jgi:hypothetical protein
MVPVAFHGSLSHAYVYCWFLSLVTSGATECAHHVAALGNCMGLFVSQLFHTLHVTNRTASLASHYL